MDLRILSLMIVVFGFALLTVWVFKPRNRERLEGHGNLIFDANNNTKTDEGDHQ